MTAVVRSPPEGPVNSRLGGGKVRGGGTGPLGVNHEGLPLGQGETLLLKKAEKKTQGERKKTFTNQQKGKRGEGKIKPKKKAQGPEDCDLTSRPGSWKQDPHCRGLAERGGAPGKTPGRKGTFRQKKRTNKGSKNEKGDLYWPKKKTRSFLLERRKEKQTTSREDKDIGGEKVKRRDLKKKNGGRGGEPRGKETWRLVQRKTGCFSPKKNTCCGRTDGGGEEVHVGGKNLRGSVREGGETAPGLKKTGGKKPGGADTMHVGKSERRPGNDHRQRFTASFRKNSDVGSKKKTTRKPAR